MLIIGVLGPLDISVHGRPVALTPPRLRTLLAVLASAADRTVSVDRLAAAVWNDDLPHDARRAVQLYVARLRHTLGAGTIRTMPDGYRLRADPDHVDALRMIRLLDTAATRPPGERELLVQATGLWRGPPFEGLRSAWLSGVAETLTERFLNGVERRVALDLADPARLGPLIAELRDLTARHPLRERFWAQLMVALLRSGRQADALECYGRLRRVLGEELGVDPGPEARQLFRRMLSGTVVAAV
jgi:DNA-binding SARP family transcriptional activator